MIQPARLEWIRPSIYTLALAALLLAQVRCSNPTTGVLEVEVTGLPAGVDAAVTVQGGSSYSEALTASQNTILSAGQYSVSASSVTSAGKVYTAAITGSPATVAVGSTATVSVVYSTPAVTPTTGTLAVAISGLPAGADADATVAGAGGFSQHLTATRTLSDLAPGSYTLTANAVSVGGTSYLPTVVGSPATVAAGGSFSASVSYAAAAPDTGSLQISVTGLPSGSDASVSIAGPGGYTGSVLTTQTLSGLMPGNYTLTAQSVSSGATTYVPTVTGSPATVTAGATATAAVSYAAMVGPTTGSLTITTAAGFSDSVQIAGPNNYTHTGTNPSPYTLTALVPGVYTITAPAYDQSGIHYVATITPSATPTVTAGMNTAVTLTYAPPPPSITSVTPIIGVETTGGTMVNIFGTNFIAGGTQVTIGGVAVTTINFFGATQLSVPAPPHAIGIVDVVVTTAGGTSAITQADELPYYHFDYFQLPTESSGGGIAAGPDGNFWFTESSINKLGKITPAGVITEYTLPVASEQPVDIAAGGDGNLWFTEYFGANISSIATDGTITEHPLPSACNTYGVSPGPGGDIWFTEFNCHTGSRNKIGRIALSSPYTITEYELPDTDFPLVVGTAVGPDGNIWWCDYDSSQIGTITPTGTVTNYDVTDYEPGFPVTGPDGNLWFTGPSAHGMVLGSMSANGIYTPHAIPDGSSILSHIAKDANGVWYAGSELGFVNTSTLTAVVYPAKGELFGVRVAADQSIWFTTENYDNNMHSAVGHLTR